MRILKRGETVFICFCGMTNFHHFNLGFDRTFWIGKISNKKQADYDHPFRCGRAAGDSFLKKPQLVFGDETVLQPGMVLAIDGSVRLVWLGSFEHK